MAKSWRYDNSLFSVIVSVLYDFMGKSKITAIHKLNDLENKTRKLFFLNN